MRQIRIREAAFEQNGKGYGVCMVELPTSIIEVGQLLPNCLKGERREPRVCLLTMDIIIFRQERFVSSWNKFCIGI